MSNLRSQLPPLNSLVAFEASARHLSFTRASQELRISREAVSRHIRILERHLDTKLFHRLHRALALTPEGADLQVAVHEGLQQIARSSSKIRRRDDPRLVTVNTTVAISSFWLTPRLPTFRERHPDAELRVMVSDLPLDLLDQGVDLALWYGDGRWPGMEAVHLFDTETFPVCTATYLEKNPPITQPADLLDHTLLSLDGPQHATENWAWWLEEAGVEPPQPRRSLGSDNYANVIQATLDAQGIALGFSGIIDGLLATRTLVRPLDQSCSRGLGVYLVAPRDARRRRSAQALHDWIRAEAPGRRP